MYERSIHYFCNIKAQILNVGKETAIETLKMEIYFEEEYKYSKY